MTDPTTLIARCRSMAAVRDAAVTIGAGTVDAGLFVHAAALAVEAGEALANHPARQENVALLHVNAELRAERDKWRDEAHRIRVFIADASPSCARQLKRMDEEREELHRLRAEVERLIANSASDHNRWATERLNLRAEVERLRVQHSKLSDALNDQGLSTHQRWSVALDIMEGRR